jgi:hypothetical protein
MTDGYTSKELELYIGNQIYNYIGNSFIGQRLDKLAVANIKSAAEDYLKYLKATTSVYPYINTATIKVDQDARDPSVLNIDLSIQDPYQINYIVGAFPQYHLSKINMTHKFIKIDDKNRHGKCSICGLEAVIFDDETLVYHDINCKNYILQQVLL